jgi:isoleucyl-tRNA synthetase
MAFCLEAERFLDDKLSNWYVRRNKRRFWKGEQGEDKQAAYQTLYAVLVTLTKLFAPIMPFLSETMYQNLVAQAAGKGPASVHLCDYPVADAALVDEQLSADMKALLRLVSQGLAARNATRIKVRQALYELRVQPSREAERGQGDRRAVERFGDQLREELNVKRVVLHDPAGGDLLSQEVQPNMRTMGKKFGAGLQDVRAAILAAPPAELATMAQRGEPFMLGDYSLDPEDVVVSYRAAEGWAGVADRGTQVAIDTRITPELAREGMARDVVRQVQELRKEAGLEMEDRIVLYLSTEADALRQAIEAHRDYIAGETLAIQWGTAPPNGEARTKKVKVEGNELTIALARVAKG